jgi:4-diphosphocytidyl-2-C-methyl-D-erythritol kinase
MHTRPPAKVNLTLRVGARRRDGFHALESIFLRIGFTDELTVALGNGVESDALTVTGIPRCPVEGNLVLRAFGAARRALGADLPPLVAHLDKRIPMAAGLGGGSSDAAAALDCALQAWGAGLAPALLAELALDLGSDVPFFVRSVGAARVSGQGQTIEPIEAPPHEIGILLVTPPFALSTRAVFARYDELDEARPVDGPIPNLANLANAMSQLRDANDLWPAAVSLAPELDVVRAELEHRTDRPWLMSGSGSTLFTIYPSPAAAGNAGRKVAAAESRNLLGATISAVDLVGPDPLWRYP